MIRACLPLAELPGLVVARGPLEDDVQSVEGVDDCDLGDEGVPCSASSSAARPFFPTDRRASLSEFERIVDRYPVFRVDR